LLTITAATTAPMAGAWLARRAVAQERLAAALVLASLVMIGTPSLLVVAGTALGIGMNPGPILLIVLVGIALAGFLAQSVLPTRRIWLCGCGTVGFVAMALVRDAPVATVLPGFVIMIPLGALGARIGWRLLGRNNAPPEPELPSARLERV
jgi:hypothetical protein